MKSNTLAEVLVLIVFTSTRSVVSAQSLNESFACKIMFQPESKYQNAALKDLQSLGISYSNQKCSFKMFKLYNDSVVGEFSCKRTNTVTLHSEAPLNFEMLSFGISCSAKFPLDADVDAEPSFKAMSSFKRDRNGTFTMEVRIHPPTDDHFHSQARHRSLPVSRNYTFYSASKPGLSITFDVQLVPYSARYFMDSLWELRIRISPDRIACERVSKDGWYYDSTGVHMVLAAGNNPTETTWLLKCLQTKELDCSAHIDRWKPFKLREIPEHGVVYCSYGAEEKFLYYFTPINLYGDMQENMSSIWESKNVMALRKDDWLTEFLVKRPGESSLENLAEGRVATFNESVTARFECHFDEYFLQIPVCKVRYNNGSEREIFRYPVRKHRESSKWMVTTQKKYKDKNGLKQSTPGFITSVQVYFDAQVEIIAVKCNAAYWNYDKYATITVPVEILRIPGSGKAPGFTVEYSNHSLTLGSYMQLNCSADSGSPEITYVWSFWAKDVKDDEDDSSERSSLFYFVSTLHDAGRVTSVLIVPVFGEDMEGLYSCTGINDAGRATRSFYVQVDEKIITDNVESRSAGVYLGLSLGIMVVLAVILLMLGRKLYAQQGRLTEMEIKLFEKGDKNEVRVDKFAHENAQFMPYNRDFELEWKDIEIYDEEKLGEGEYGVVFKGRLATNSAMIVAVKTVKAGADKSVIWALLSELKVMIHLGSHENVVKLIGACTSFLQEGRVYVVIEHCPMGSLKSCLMKTNKDAFLQRNDSSLEIHGVDPNDDSVNELTTTDLFRWAIQIARGMQHLENMKVIHGDLAARNILLLSKTQVKITDFGLSTQLLSYEKYARKSQTKLPWRWLALESLKSNVFSHASDVWSYGVTLWEIFTLGLVPYPGMAWTNEFVTLLEQNLRLHQPKFASDRLYKIISQCWEVEPRDRPNFQQLEGLLVNLG